MAGNSTLPNWIRSFLKKEDLGNIESAVQHAESETSGEVVPMIVRSSSTMGHLPLQIFLMLTILSLVLLKFHPWLYLMIAISVSASLALLLARWPWLQRLLVPKKDQENDVFHRAHFEFAQHGLMNTKERTGILIFVSLMEHRCVVLADKGISDKVPQETWDGIIENLVQKIKEKEAAEGFKSAIQKCGEILAKHLPASAQNTNELRNQLIIKS